MQKRERERDHHHHHHILGNLHPFLPSHLIFLSLFSPPSSFFFGIHRNVCVCAGIGMQKSIGGRVNGRGGGKRKEDGVGGGHVILWLQRPTTTYRDMTSNRKYHPMFFFVCVAQLFVHQNTFVHLLSADIFL